MYKYAMKARPPMPGALPNGFDVLDVFDDRTYVEEAGCLAWAIVDYEFPLTQRQKDDYELADVNEPGEIDSNEKKFERDYLRWDMIYQNFTEDEIEAHKVFFYGSIVGQCGVRKEEFIDYMEYLLEQKEEDKSFLDDQKSAVLLYL